MSKQNKQNKELNIPGLIFIKSKNGISEYKLEKNNLTILYKNFPNTGVVTTNITYRVGARDEGVGETGLAHMLEHMLFKPTKSDLKFNKESSAMLFERDTGCILNANTWRDRTTYFFSYPAEYFDRALKIEADRMTNVALSDTEFLPERNNVLSEFDMYFGDPKFALSVALSSTAFQNHPYRHETIGVREDIERYIVDMLDNFYKKYYRPSNATLSIMGDVALEKALTSVIKSFSSIKNPKEEIARLVAIEPKQEGLRRVEIKRDSNTNVLAIAFKHAAYPTNEWVSTAVLMHFLAGNEDSILQTKLVDSGLASSIEYSIEPTSDKGLCILYVTLAKDSNHKKIEDIILAEIGKLEVSKMESGIKKAIASYATDLAFGRDGSLKTAMAITEDISVGDWTAGFKIENQIKKITSENIISLATKLFAENNLTIGYFIGNKS